MMRKLTKQERLLAQIYAREIQVQYRQQQRDKIESHRQDMAKEDRKRMMGNGSLWQWRLLRGWQYDDDYPYTPPMV